MGKVAMLSGLAGVFGYFAVVSAQSPAPPWRQAPDARVAAGKTLFATTCSSDYCHGTDGDGGGAPSLRERRYTQQFLTRVIADGVPSTAMPAFQKEMGSDQVAQVVAYVLSLRPAWASAASAAAGAAATTVDAGQRSDARPVQPAAPSSPPAAAIGSSARAAGAVELRGDPAAGRAIFFDPGQTANCRFCHMLGERGGHGGPDLTRVATKAARDLFLSIVMPRSARGSAFATVAVTLNDGRRVVGVKRDETPDAMRLYDASSVPPVLRTFLKANVTSVNEVDVPAMPADYASRYSLKQLLDLVAFLKSGDPASRASVTLTDLF